MSPRQHQQTGEFLSLLCGLSAVVVALGAYVCFRYGEVVGYFAGSYSVVVCILLLRLVYKIEELLEQLYPKRKDHGQT